MTKRFFIKAISSCDSLGGEQTRHGSHRCSLLQPSGIWGFFYLLPLSMGFCFLKVAAVCFVEFMHISKPEFPKGLVSMSEGGVSMNPSCPRHLCV